jgi:hypothetical protein
MLQSIDGQPQEVPHDRGIRQPGSTELTSLPLATVVVLAVVRQQLARWAR